ncbi:MAG TPA: hypothetical protein VFF14_11430 [Candidatus Deferrimicrobium sp.]|nr:hypothetical protein [Candidatus Deferrimicrobium sp.]
MKFPLIKGQRWPTIIILILFGLPIVLTGIFALSFPSLAAPPKPIPKLNYQESQMLTYNTVTKAKAAFLTMFQTGTGRGTIELSEAEINALLSRYLVLHLPQGFLLKQHPLSLTYDPDVLVNQVCLPLVKNPGLAIERLGIENHKLRLTALLSFRLGF